MSTRRVSWLNCANSVYEIGTGFKNRDGTFPDTLVQLSCLSASGLIGGRYEYVGPKIAVPTITMEGDANGALHAPAEAYRGKFTGKYEYRLITGGIGHNLPQEAPQAFAKGVIDVDAF
jgi:hypothetical protein